ncbi:MAG: ABC transporter substrate-binding protein, partial [Desulfobacterales bacterium]
YQMVEHNKLTGFGTELVKTVLERMDVKIRSLHVYPWKRAIAMMEKGQPDALFSANYTKERENFVWYPEEPLIQSPWILWVREEDRLKFDSLEDLREKRIGVVRGYSYTSEFLDFIQKFAEIDEVTDDATNFRKLNAGRVDYVAAELGNGYWLLKKLKLKKIIPLRDKPIKSDGLYLIFSKSRISKETAEQFSAELKKFKQEEAYQILCKKYFRLQ